MKFRPIVLAGGSGRRLWPLSTKEKPKQFIPLFGELTLFDLTLQRLNKGPLFKKPIIVTSIDYLEFIEESIKRTGIDPYKIILEPVSRNTFPAITLAVCIALLKDEDETFFVAPSDHHISNNLQFHNACNTAKNKAAEGGLILFGVKPERPSAEYGYIVPKDRNLETKDIQHIKEFVEKPNIGKSKKLIEGAGALLNAGMFTFKGSWFLEACENICSESIREVKMVLPEKFPSDLIFIPDRESFLKLSKESFDKIFVEKNNLNFVTLLDAEWADLGSWVSLSTMQRDPSSNMTLFLENNNREKRPWGFFEILMETSSSKVKLLSISPGQRLSLQKHLYRSETWYLINGEAKVTKGNQRFTMSTGDSIIIHKNEEHRVENLSTEPVEIIEIQTGTYFGEDDIIRLQDSYGREDI